MVFQSFVLDTGEITQATGTSQTHVKSFVFPERRTICGFYHRVGFYTSEGPLDGEDALEAISEITPQAEGLKEGVIDVLHCEVHLKNYVAAPASGNVVIENPVREKTVWFPSDLRPTFEKGDSINILLWLNNKTGLNLVGRSYVIFFYK